MITHVNCPAGSGPTILEVGDRVRVASGVFGRLGQIRSISPGHILVHYDCDGREVIDLARRPVWVVQPVTA